MDQSVCPSRLSLADSVGTVGTAAFQDNFTDRHGVWAVACQPWSQSRTQLLKENLSASCLPPAPCLSRSGYTQRLWGELL